MEHIVYLRLVTTADDAAAEEDAAISLDDYNLSEIAPLALSADGAPADHSLRDSLFVHGLSEARFVDPVTVVVAASLASLATRLVNHWIKSREAGVQIDMRTTPPTLSRLAGVPLGTVAIIDTTGKVSLQKKSYDSPENAIANLSRLLRSSQ